MANKDSSVYSANRGQIASPNTDPVVDSLKRGESKSLGVNHNKHLYSFKKGSKTIETPATDLVMKKK